MMNQLLMMLEVKRHFPDAFYVFSSDPLFDDEIALTSNLHIQIGQYDYGLGKVLPDSSFDMYYYADFASCLELAVALDR